MVGRPGIKCVEKEKEEKGRPGIKCVEKEKEEKGRLGIKYVGEKGHQVVICYLKW